MPLSIEPRTGEFRWIVVSDRPLAALAGADEVIQRAVDSTLDMGGGSVQLWIRHVGDGDDELAVRHGFAPYRDLWQLRVPLPTDPSDLTVRSYDPRDADELLAVNNRAFAWHPEQGALTREGLDTQMGESWFEPRGLLVHEVGGAMAGFCWTKPHPDTDPPMGEIFVICVDPAFHGRGIGAPLTRAGLDHLHRTGFDVGMLYVESDNDAANRIYERIGFRHHHTDRAYRLDRAS